MFWTKSLTAENALLRGMVSDLHTEIARLYREHREERRELLDRIIALGQPMALRELRRPTEPPLTPFTQRAVAADTIHGVVRSNFPGVGQEVARPELNRQAKDLSVGITMSDVERAAALARDSQPELERPAPPPPILIKGR